MVKKILWGLGILLLIVMIGVVVYLNTNQYDASDLVDQYLASFSGKVIKDEDYFAFTMEGNNNAILYYPGGKVDPWAYGGYASRFAQEGFDTYILKMPFNLAIFSPDKGELLREKLTEEYEKVYFAGHSLGGAIGAGYVKEHIDSFDGIIFFGAYPSKSSDLSMTTITSISIAAQNDGLISLEKIEEQKKYHPDNAVFYTIEGGVHAYFGFYGPQSGDGVPRITPQEQLNQVIEILKKELDGSK